MLYFIKNIDIINLRTNFDNCTQKVGEPLSKEKIAKNVFQNVGAIAKTSDFKNMGLTNYDIAKLEQRLGSILDLYIRSQR